MKTLRTKIRKFVTGTLRLIIAGVFIFSGAVKAIDPMGMAYKLDAYLAHFGVLLPSDIFTQVFAIALATLEFVLGAHLLLGMRPRTTLSGIFFLLLAMTGLTTYVYLYNPVPDCGCFGDAVVLTNGETLAKNIVLLAMTLWLMRFGLKPVRLISERSQWLTSLYSLIFIVMLGIYSLRMLPPIDFLPYKVGADISEAMLGEYESVFVYEKNGVRQTFTAENLPDSTWTFAAAETRTLKEPTIPNFQLLRDGEDITGEILADTSFVFLLALPDLQNADDGCNDRINDIVDYCRDNDYKFYALVASGESEGFLQWTDRTGAAYEALSAERDEIRSLVRSNPGLVLLYRGRIEGKWSNNNLPELETGDKKIDTLLSGKSAEQTFVGVLVTSILWFVLPLLLIIVIDKLWTLRKTRRNNIINNNQKRKTMRKKIVAGNWKMNLNLQDGKALAAELKNALAADAPNCDVVVCTPFIHLASVAEILEGSVVGLGAENCADKVSGAYTGEVSAEMVKSTGAQYVILGHSERRAYYGETAAILKEKTKLALANGLKVIFCIGEVLEERESGRQNEVVKEQLEGSLFELTAEELKNVILAYEPVWAIGTGKTATAEQAEDMHAFIRGVIAEKFGAEAAEEISILYGGSCKPSNAKEIFAKPNVDGGLIGGAALKCADFKGIIDAWK